MQALIVLQIALTVGYLATCLLNRAGLAPRALHIGHRVLLGLALLSPLLVGFIDVPWTPPATLRDGLSLTGPATELAVALPGSALSLTLPASSIAPAVGGLPSMLWVLLLLGVVRTAVAVVRLSRRLDAAVAQGERDGIAVLMDPSATAPFAALLPQGRVVVLDAATAMSAQDARLALHHETQHHAQGDPAFAWIWLGVRAAFGWNPAVGAWARLAAELEEQACDAAVVARSDVSPRAYGALLLSFVARPPAPVGATGLPPRSPLHRRLLMLARPTPPRRLRALTSIAAAATLVLATAVGTASLAADLRLEGARVDAAYVQADTVGLDVPDVQAIRRELRRMVTRQGGFYRRGLDRRPDWQKLVDGSIQEAGLPAFVAAIPLVESGYANWGAPESAEAQSAAPGAIPGRGLWMFIGPTARTYGLRVDDTVDQRLDPSLETAAAMTLLTDLHEEFGDWGLALAAYNQGSEAVKRAMKDGNSRDPWALIDAGHLNPYAAQVMAAALVLESPQLLD